MITPSKVNSIRKLGDDGDLSLRMIAETVDVGVTTVWRYLHKESGFEKQPRPPRPPKHPSLDKFVEFLDAMLRKNLRARWKERMNIKSMFQVLQREHGYPGCYGTVRSYVKQRRAELRREYGRETGDDVGYLPLEAVPGRAQVDFGEVHYRDAAGTEHAGNILVVSFPYSNKGYAHLLPAQNLDCLLTGLQAIFRHLGGVPERLLFDNLKAVVVKVMAGDKRKLTDGFMRFQSHYGFQASFCNPASGNEKGNVERKVAYVRQKFFVPCREITDFKALNTELLAWCEQDAQRIHYRHQRTIASLWAEDAARLRPLPRAEFRCGRFEIHTVDKCGWVTVANNRYAVPPALFGFQVLATVTADRVDIATQGACPETYGYPRVYGQQQEIADWTVFLAVMCAKPHGFPESRIFRFIPRPVRDFILGLESRSERQAGLRLVRELVKARSAGGAAAVLASALRLGYTDVDGVRKYLQQSRDGTTLPLLLPPPAATDAARGGLAAYDALIAPAGRTA